MYEKCIDICKSVLENVRFDLQYLNISDFISNLTKNQYTAVSWTHQKNNKLHYHPLDSYQLQGLPLSSWIICIS